MRVRTRQEQNDHDMTVAMMLSLALFVGGCCAMPLGLMLESDWGIIAGCGGAMYGGILSCVFLVCTCWEMS